MKKTFLLFIVPFILCNVNLNAQSKDIRNEIQTKAKDIEQKVIDWRRDIHQNPELGNREVRTAAMVAKHLESHGMEVTTNVGITGVIGILKGNLSGP
ncbi:MAG: metal-dependent amidase/aminoacylase/carboxypeptidase family protein, partial [Vicingaceae bacterium]